LFRRLEVGDVALFLENAGNLRLQLRGRNIQFLMTRPYGIANPRQKIRYRIGQTHRFSFIPRSLAATRTCGNVLLTFSQSFRSNLVVARMRARPPEPAGSPGGLNDARDLTLERQLTEAEAADAELPQKRARPATQLTTIVLAALELRLACVLDSFCSSCHKCPSILAYAVWRNGIPNCRSRAR